MARPRRQTYTLKMYLSKIKDGDIDNSADVQRNFVWKSEQINELLVTVLTDDYIPPIILGEEENTQLHIADGGQRSSALKLFRYGNYKITSSIEDSVIPYKKKVKDENGAIVWEDAVFDIKNCTYEKLPGELKKKFDEYQIDTIIHENCDRLKISKYIKRYNNHVAMNTNQKAFVYISNFAGYIRKILNRNFFVENSSYTEAEKIKGVVERVVIESVMCMFHLDEWKKQAKQIALYLNKNSSKEEFDTLDANLHRLEQVITEDIKDIFNSKDSFIWLTLFHRFTDLGAADSRFAEFLREFKHGLRNKSVAGKQFDTVGSGAGTKDKAVIIAKLHILETLMMEFLQINKKDSEAVDVLKYIQENINPEAEKEDIELYEEMCRDYFVEVEEHSNVRAACNRPSMIMLVAYACEAEQDASIKNWIVDFDRRNTIYIRNQRENYLHMKQDLDRFIAGQEKQTR